MTLAQTSYLGRTSRIMTKPHKGTVPLNYRPMTYLFTTWKLLSDIIKAKISMHMSHPLAKPRMGLQEQAQTARTIEAGVHHTRQDPRCRLCKEAPEANQHIIAG